MHASRPLKIVIASAGRRAHYVEWFRSALSSQGISGEIIAMEYRTTSPTFGHADRNVVAPAYNSPEYCDFMRDWVRAERPDLFLSLNDYENQILSDGLADELRELGCKVAVLTPFAQSVVLDKYRMAAVLAEHGLATPHHTSRQPRGVDQSRTATEQVRCEAPLRERVERLAGRFRPRPRGSRDHFRQNCNWKEWHDGCWRGR